MKKRIKTNKTIIIIAVIVLLLATIFILIERDIFTKTENVLFYLEEKYYGDSTLKEITVPEIEKLIDEEESFGVFIHQPMCSNSYAFNKVLIDYAKENNISFYMISFSEIKNMSIGEHVKYYPSFVIYKDGEYVSHLEADNNDHLDYYKSTKGFNSWFSKYVKLK